MARKTVAAKLLLGWMAQREAVETLNSCEFDPPLTNKKAIRLWREYRDKVEALEPRQAVAPPSLAFSNAEQVAAEAHIQRMKVGRNAQFYSGVVKVNPGDLVAHQFYVITEQANVYATTMQDEAAKINLFLGVGMSFKGPLVPKQINPKLAVVDLPHAEFVITPIVGGFDFAERDRYVTVVSFGNRMLLWGGYHRTYGILSHIDPEGAGNAPLLTVMTGSPDLARFFSDRSDRPAVRDSVLGQRPALLRDFLDDNLCISVRLHKKRARGRIEQIKPGKLRAKIELVYDES